MVPRDETHSECRIAHWRHAKKNVKMRGGENVNARKRAVLVREKVRDARLVQRLSVPSCFCRDSGLVVRCARGRARLREEKSQLVIN